MGEQASATCGFPDEAIPERGDIDLYQHKVTLAREVFLRRFHRLGASGKVDVAVAAIDRAAVEHTGALGLAPQIGRANLVDRRHARSCEPDRPYRRAPPAARQASAPNPKFAYPCRESDC